MNLVDPTPGTATAPAAVPGAGIAAALDAAVTWIRSALGTPYDYGVTDCSWFTQQAYLAAGINIGRDTASQMAAGSPVGADGPQNYQADLALAQPGDLIFYGRPGATGQNAHVVFYLGNGMVAQEGGADANISPVFPAASPNEPFAGIRRYLGQQPQVSGYTNVQTDQPAGSTGTGSQSSSQGQNAPQLSGFSWSDLNPVTWFDQVTGIASDFGDAGSAVVNGVAFLIAPGTWIRFGEIVLGGLMALGGMAVLAIVLAGHTPSLNAANSVMGGAKLVRQGFGASGLGAGAETAVGTVAADAPFLAAVA